MKILKKLTALTLLCGTAIFLPIFASTSCANKTNENSFSTVNKMVAIDDANLSQFLVPKYNLTKDQTKNFMKIDPTTKIAWPTLIGLNNEPITFSELFIDKQLANDIAVACEAPNSESPVVVGGVNCLARPFNKGLSFISRFTSSETNSKEQLLAAMFMNPFLYSNEGLEPSFQKLYKLDLSSNGFNFLIKNMFSSIGIDDKINKTLNIDLSNNNLSQFVGKELFQSKRTSVKYKELKINLLNNNISWQRMNVIVHDSNWEYVCVNRDIAIDTKLAEANKDLIETWIYKLTTFDGRNTNYWPSLLIHKHFNHKLYIDYIGIELAALGLVQTFGTGTGEGQFHLDNVTPHNFSGSVSFDFRFPIRNNEWVTYNLSLKGNNNQLVGIIFATFILFCSGLTFYFAIKKIKNIKKDQ